MAAAKSRAYDSAVGAWRIEALRVAGHPDATAQDVAVADGATEFSIPELGVFAVVDLNAQ